MFFPISLIFVYIFDCVLGLSTPVAVPFASNIKSKLLAKYLFSKAFEILGNPFLPIVIIFLYFGFTITLLPFFVTPFDKISFLICSA